MIYNNILHYNILFYYKFEHRRCLRTALCWYFGFIVGMLLSISTLILVFQNMEQQQIETSGKRKRKNPAPNRFSPAGENTDITEKLLKASDGIDESDNEATGENDDQEMFVDDQEAEDDDNDSGMVSTTVLCGVPFWKMLCWNAIFAICLACNLLKF